MSRITNNEFYSAYTYLSDIYGIHIAEDIFETMGYVAWSKIGNRQTRMYKLQAIPMTDDIYGWYVDVPCNADIIEAITTNYEDYQKTHQTIYAILPACGVFGSYRLWLGLLFAHHESCGYEQV